MEIIIYALFIVFGLGVGILIANLYTYLALGKSLQSTVKEFRESKAIITFLE